MNCSENALNIHRIFSSQCRTGTVLVYILYRYLHCSPQKPINTGQVIDYEYEKLAIYLVNKFQYDSEKPRRQFSLTGQISTDLFVHWCVNRIGVHCYNFFFNLQSLPTDRQ